MSTHFFTDLPHIDRKTELFLLAFFSSFGAAFGVIIACSSNAYFFSMMRMAAFRHVSIVDLTLVTLFPFLITAIAFFLSKPYLFFVIAFFKAFLYTLMLSCICIEFLQAGWLVCFLLLFSDTFVTLILHWYWVRHIHGFLGSAFTELFFCMAFSLGICLIDYIWVAPFLTALMNN